jgi:outer membrane autotransporter protein
LNPDPRVIGVAAVAEGELRDDTVHAVRHEYVTARLAWVHELQGERSTTQSFLIAPGFDFTTDGAAAVRDALRMDAGVSLNVGERLAIYGDFTGRFSQGGGSLGGMAGFRFRF